MVVKENRAKAFFLEMGARVWNRWGGGGGAFKTKEVKRVMVYAFFL